MAIPDSLLARLASSHFPITPERLSGWWVEALPGGGNNRLFRVSQGSTSLCVKVCLADARRRAHREYAALRRLEGLRLAPAPVRFEPDAFALPLVVMEWLGGSPASPEELHDADWKALSELAGRVFAQPADNLSPVVVGATDPAEMTALLEEQRRLYDGPLPARMEAAISAWEARAIEWTGVSSRTLCHGDSNPSNWRRTPDGWRLIDWEYSGSGDPAFALAEWRVQPEWRSVGASRWNAVIGLLAERLGDAGLLHRAAVYSRGMRLFWALRLLRFLREVPAGNDLRLARRPPDFTARCEERLDHYLTSIELNDSMDI